jgi:transcriptional regulator with XRE-family HTH domain
MSKRSANPVDVHVGKRIRARRGMLNLSQGQLGDKIGLTFQQVQKYENGNNRVSASRLMQIAGVLKVPVSFFFDGLPATTSGKVDLTGTPDIVGAFFSLPHATELAEAFIALEHNLQRSTVTALVQSMVPAPAKKLRKAA